MRRIAAMFFSIILFASTIVGCYPSEKVPSSTATITSSESPTPEINATPTVNANCPINSNTSALTSLNPLATKISFIIDESHSIAKVDPENYRYKIIKFLLTIIREFFNKTETQAFYRVNYLQYNIAPFELYPYESVDSDEIQNVMNGLDTKINSPVNNIGDFYKHDEVIKQFIDERSKSTSLERRVLYYFTDGTFFLNDRGDPNSMTFDSMDQFSKQLGDFSTSSGNLDKIIIFILSDQTDLGSGVQIYWKGIDTLPGVHVIWFTPENLENVLNELTYQVLGEPNGNLVIEEEMENNDANQENNVLTSTALEGWRIFSIKTGQNNCNLHLPSLPYNVTRETSGIDDFVIKYDEDIVENESLFDDIKIYNDCKNFSMPNPAEKLLCKNPEGIYFFWWRAEEFPLILNFSNKGNNTQICNGVNNSKDTNTTINVDIIKPGTVAWTQILPCFTPHLRIEGLDEIFTATPSEGRATFTIDQSKIENLIGEKNFSVFFTGSNCNLPIGETQTSTFNFIHYPIQGSDASISDDGLEIIIPLRFFEPSENYTAIASFRKDSVSDCKLTADISFAYPDINKDLTVLQKNDLLSIRFNKDKLGENIMSCDELTISWSSEDKSNDYWGNKAEICGMEITPTILSYRLIWDKTNKRLLRVEKK